MTRTEKAIRLFRLALDKTNQVQVLFIPCNVISWNETATAHWRTYKALKDEQNQATYYAIKQAKLKPVTGLVDIIITAHWKHARPHDVDNICSKHVIDQLVKNKILKGDSMKYVDSVTLRGLNNAETEGLFISIITK